MTLDWLRRKLWDLESKAKALQPPESSLFWLLVLVIPPVVILSTHVWLRTAYTSGVFDLRGFLNQYDHGIYRYRLLGRETLLFIYRHLAALRPDRHLAMPRGPDGSLLFYASYVLLDSICFSISNLLLLVLLANRKKHLPETSLATYFFLILVQALAMAVLTPYDQLAYMFLLASLLVSTQRIPWVAYLLVALAAILGTLTRETQFLVTSAMFTAALFCAGDRGRRLWKTGTLNLVVFGLVYAILRLEVPGAKDVTGGSTVGGKWAVASFLVLTLLFCISTLLAIRIHAKIGPSIVLLVLSIPYILPILASGILRELRLLVPILLAQTFVYVTLRLNSEEERQEKQLRRASELAS
ncbi:MAG TPA: hypothetical protein VHX11_05750 [Acidobacteriaceae bacterium]|nr:hypothetical protein [Acidobacteriaceae bacterium]